GAPDPVPLVPVPPVPVPPLAGALNFTVVCAWTLPKLLKQTIVYVCCVPDASSIDIEPELFTEPLQPPVPSSDAVQPKGPLADAQVSVSGVPNTPCCVLADKVTLGAASHWIVTAPCPDSVPFWQVSP